MAKVTDKFLRSTKLLWEYGEVGFGSAKHEDYRPTVEFYVGYSRVECCTYKTLEFAVEDIAKFMKGGNINDR